MNMKHQMKSVILAGASALLLLTASTQAADLTGTWTWSTPGRNGGADRISTLTLKKDAAALSGKVSAPGRDGSPVETPITDGKVDGDNISFSVVRAYNGNSSTNEYSGAVTVDKITGKMASVNRNGEPQSRDWVTKRTVTPAAAQ
jgi:hypothetical protein